MLFTFLPVRNHLLAVYGLDFKYAENMQLAKWHVFFIFFLLPLRSLDKGSIYSKFIDFSIVFSINSILLKFLSLCQYVVWL